MGSEAVIELEPHPKLSRSKKILYGISVGIIVFAIGFMLLVAFWLVYPYRTAEFEEPVQILNENNEIAIGEPVVLRVELTKYTNVFPTRSEFITCDDGNLTFLDPGPTRNIPPGTYTFVNDTNLLPAKLRAGATCHYHFRYDYKVNPVRTITKEWFSEEFLVLEEVKSDGS